MACPVRPLGNTPSMAYDDPQDQQRRPAPAAGYEPTVETPQLDAYLRSPYNDIPRQLPPHEIHARLRELLTPQEEADLRPLPSQHPTRVLLCWRIARALGILLGRLSDDEPLEIAAADFDAPITIVSLPPSAQRLMNRGHAGTLGDLLRHTGLTLLPPPATAAPEAIENWCCAVEIINYRFKLDSYAQSQQVLAFLIDPERASQCDVTPRQLYALEELLVDEMQRLILEVGERNAVRHMHTRHGMSRSEVHGLIRLARAEALRTAGSNSVEEDRVLMVARLTDFLARSREAMNMSDEMKALKELGKIQGLTRTEPEDMARDFLKVISTVADRHDRIQAAKEVELLMPSAPVQEDAAELREFDRENSTANAAKRVPQP